jgi:CobQ-like glutamine amidotransferase family enzyme
MVVKLVSLFGKHLDLNGDQSNLKVLAKRLSWLGVQSEIVSLDKGQALPADADLIFLGHGSKAAWADIDSELQQLVPELQELIAKKVAFMAVASGHERAIELGLLPGSAAARDRISKFEIAQLDDLEILGYLNSATDAPVIQKHGLAIGTQLHGPVFAKNPEFTDVYIRELAGARGLALVSSTEVEQKNNASLVADIVGQVWELERDLASE